MNALYIRKSGVGFMRMEGDSLRLLPGGEKFAKIVIYALLPYTDSRQTPAVLAEENAENTYYKTCKPFLAATRTHGLFVFDGASFRPFKTEADAYLIENLIRCGTVLSDGNYALGTLHGGLVVIGPQGNLRHIVDKTNGLHDNSVYHTYFDSRGGLWLALNRGIVRLELPSPLSLHTNPPALRSSVNKILQQQSKLYATTTEGVYAMEQSSKPGAPPVFQANCRTEGANRAIIVYR